MQYCTECGARLPDDALFCTSCGMPVRPWEKQNGPGERAADADGGGPARETNPRVQPKRSSGGKVAAIVIILVVVLFAAAGYLFDKAVKDADYSGYWESSAVEVNGEEQESYFGRDIDGLFGLQINDDGTASMCSAFTQKTFSGKWTKTADGLVISGGEESYELTKKDGRIYLFNRGLFLIYSPAQGDIDHPSIPHGSFSREDGASDGASPAPDTQGGESGYVDGSDFEIAITGAEAVKDGDGKDALRVSFTFTNHDDHAQSAWDTLDFVAIQNGKALQGEDDQRDTDAGRLLTARVRPGVKIQCCYTFAFDPAGGDIVFTLQGWDRGTEGGTVSRRFTPGKLPGAPAPLAIAPVAEPKWTTKLPGEGVLDDEYGAAVLGAELTTDKSGQPAVRIRYRFENGSDEKISLADALHVYAYQDGVSLEPTEAENPTDGDAAFEKKVGAGTSAELSRVFRLRNTDSQLEAEVESIGSYDAIGQTYSVKG